MSKKVEAEHGVVCRIPDEEFAYFGWPSLARMENGTLVVASSGLRTQHVCPFGKTVLNFSKDDGRTWSEPQVINNTPMDDRDAGVLSLGGKALLVSWFTSDTRNYLEGAKKYLPADAIARWEEVLHTWTQEMVDEWMGSWVILSDDLETWSDPIRVPVSTPHGPIRLADGDLLYYGKAGFNAGDQHAGDIMACRSSDGGRTWTRLGAVPLCEGTQKSNYHEPHVVELEDGKLVGIVRFEFSDANKPNPGQINFSLFQADSEDGGATWTQARPMGIYGSPPHLIRHSSGVLVCVYGYRKEPYGQRVALSDDGGTTWDSDIILRDDGPTWDLGYPASTEMPDGSIFTIYYQQYQTGEKCSLLWSHWRLP